MLHLPPERAARWKMLSATLKELKTDVQRLWKRVPQVSYQPHAEISIPNVPDFGTIGTVNTAGTINTTGTNTFQTTAGNCDGCTSLPARWKLVVSGVTNRDCSQCSDYNGTFYLYPSTGITWTLFCRFETVERTPCNNIGTFTGTANVPRYILFFNSGSSNWEVRAAGDGGDIFKGWTQAGSFTCLGTNVFGPGGTTSNPGINECQNWPSTVTLVPE